MELVNTNHLMANSEVHFIKHFLALKAASNKATANLYERSIKDFFQVACVEDVTLDDVINVNYLVVEKYIIKLGDKYSSATIHNKISAMASLYRWLLKHRDNRSGKTLIYYNPFANLQESLPKVINKETEFLTMDECRLLLDSFLVEDIVELRDKLIFALAFTTGIRKNELISIKLEDVITIGEHTGIKVVRKGGHKDTVKVKESVKQLMDAYVNRTSRCYQNHGDRYLLIGHSNVNINKVDANKKLATTTINRMVKKRCEQVGITRNITVHSTRHTAITLAILGGASIEKVRDFAGHSNIATTSRYVHSVNRFEDNAADYISL